MPKKSVPNQLPVRYGRLTDIDALRASLKAQGATDEAIEKYLQRKSLKTR
jgi:hypothetical protein